MYTFSVNIAITQKIKNLTKLRVVIDFASLRKFVDSYSLINAMKNFVSLPREFRNFALVLQKISQIHRELNSIFHFFCQNSPTTCNGKVSQACGITEEFQERYM
uniref:Uncharacterized protein n=1 Tax=Onchocerca volvulus TaxID=6282 RepID=A0A8R1TN94_ONCVO